MYIYIYTLQATVYTKKAQSTDRGPQASPKPTSWVDRTSGHPDPTPSPGPQDHRPGSPRCARCTEAGRMGLGTAHPGTRLSSSCSQETAVRGCRDLARGSSRPHSSSHCRDLGSFWQQACPCPVCALPSLGPGLTPGTYGPRAGDPTEPSYTKPCSGAAQLCPQSERETAPPGSPPDFFLSIYPPRTQWSSPEDGTLGSNPAGPGQPQQPPQGPGRIPHTRASLRGHRSRCMDPHVPSVSVPETLALPSPLLHLCFSCQLPYLPLSGHRCWLPRRPPSHLYHELPLSKHQPDHITCGQASRAFL